jgi:glycosyltransferase involved in cell wall biosynthesis
VVTIHDLVWKHAPETMRPVSRWLDANLMPEAVRLADKVITVSKNTADDLLANMPFSEGKVCSIPLGVAVLAQPQLRESMASLGLQAPYILFVGTLEPRKNLARLLEAYSRLPNTLKLSALLVIVGGKGWGGVDVVTLANQFGIGDRVRVFGYVSDERLAALYAHALFLAMPSLYEGFGLPLLEAMVRGTPVLTSHCASMPEVAGDAALLVNPHDVESIRKGLAEMLGNEKRREALVAQSKVNAERFSWDRATDETLKVFETAIAARRNKLGHSNL